MINQKNAQNVKFIKQLIFFYFLNDSGEKQQF
ncbi:hypothetical protein P288_23520 [Salmonella enterica subsp. arizonae serovar 18:z4,z23:- str. CVM N7307]|nr:hypothetical protein STU288_17025 [Salmonella enterica subsp. enterica serovar Typhimurium str. U288]AGQ70121.1 hypothetical protein CFSAN001921_00185 [Salmonella enterica subsp. enterica serovar Typhimurium var. 5- str. CFSAN001921]AGQ88408.1 hypothetical protein SE451236_22920 [Salmonella enterica subsp. enterica serovar 4,[5],12:i:- str. 08-1736]AVU69457.1 hypothetical protein FORC58_0504 [Salmonella enterica subsp. enterica serovar Typhimurium]EKS98158.1 hypothetical protein B571_16783 [